MKKLKAPKILSHRELRRYRARLRRTIRSEPWIDDILYRGVKPPLGITCPVCGLDQPPIYFDDDENCCDCHLHLLPPHYLRDPDEW